MIPKYTNRRKNLILDPLLDEIKQQVDYDTIRVFKIDGDEARLILYRGDIPQTEAASIVIKLDNIDEYTPLSPYSVLVPNNDPKKYPEDYQEHHETFLRNREKQYSTITIPVYKDESVLAFFDLLCKLPKSYSNEEYQIVSSMVNDNLLCVETGIALSEELQRSAEMESLFRIQTEIAKLLDANEIFETVVASAKKLLFAQNAYLFLLDADKIVLRAKDELAPTKIKLGDAFTEDDVFLLKEYKLSGADDDLSLISNPWLYGLASSHSFLGAPIFSQESLIGYLLVTDKNVGIFGKADRQILTRFASMISIVLQNSYLYKLAEYMGVLEERQRLSREFHDDILQRMSYFKMETDVIHRYLKNDQGDQAENHLIFLENAVDETISNLRDVIFNLREELAPRNDFIPSLERYLEFYRINYGLMVRFENQAAAIPELDESQIAQISRIIQESLMNIKKHSKAEYVELSLRNEGDNFVIIIYDDGIGFNSKDIEGKLRTKFGLKIMEERAKSIDGVLTIESQPNQGTSVILSIPM